MSLADEYHIPTTPAQRALLVAMEQESEATYCAGWDTAIEQYVVTAATRDTDEGRMFAWLIEQAGGIWTWQDGQPVFAATTRAEATE